MSDPSKMPPPASAVEPAQKSGSLLGWIKVKMGKSLTQEQSSPATTDTGKEPSPGGKAETSQKSSRQLRKGTVKIIKNLTDNPVSLPRVEGEPLELGAKAERKLRPGEVAEEKLADLEAEGKITVEERSENFAISNLTPYRIAIERKQDAKEKLVIPAFGTRELSDEKMVWFGVERWVQANLVRARSTEEYETNRWGNITKFAPALYFVFAIVLKIFVNDPTHQDDAIRELLMRIAVWFHKRHLYYWSVVFLVFLPFMVVILTVALSKKKERRQQVWQGLTQGFIFLTTVAIAIGGPLFAIFWTGTDSKSHLHDSANDQATLGRFIQFVFISIAALTPAALFFLFDRQRLRTLRDSFFRDVTRLDPHVRSLDDAESIHGLMVNEVYGDPDNMGRGRIGGQKRGPVIMATILITIGWLLALRAGKPGSPATVMDWFSPNQTPMVFGFLGAYFFGLNMLFLRYVRSDLKPKAYSHLVVRILIVCTFCWALPLLPKINGDVEPDSAVKTGEIETTNTAGVAGVTATPSNGVTRPAEAPSSSKGSSKAADKMPVWVLVAAFIVGVFPQTGINLMVEFLRQRKSLRWAIPSLQEKQALGELEGVSLYDRTRLLEEGIENIEHLAHHDLIDLVLQTRIPVTRLVDWVDQAILYLHLGIEDTKEARADKAKPEPEQDAAPPKGESLQDIGRTNLKILHQHGIRNATTLERVVQMARSAEAIKTGTEDTEAKDKLLSLLGKAEGGPPRFEIIHPTVAGEQWMPYLRKWRQFGEQTDETRKIEYFENEWKQS